MTTMFGRIAPIRFAAAAAVAAASFGFAAPAQAVVFPGDTFSVDVSGFNSAGTTGYLLTPSSR